MTETVTLALTDAELAEIEARAEALLAEWHSPALLPSIYPNTVLRLVAELRRLRGMRCETCACWARELAIIMPSAESRDILPQYRDFGRCKPLGRFTRKTFGCNQWRAEG